MYSPRPGTPAASMPHQVPLAVKKRRLGRLQERLHELSKASMRAMVGSVQKVLVEGPAKKPAGYLCGRAENNRMVNFSGDAERLGQLLDIRITEAKSNSLLGEALS